MNYKTLRNRCRRFESPCVLDRLSDDTETVIMTEQIENHGVIQSRLVTKVIKLSDKFSGSKASDYALENFIATGAVSQLREVRLGSDLDPDNLASQLQTRLESVQAQPTTDPILQPVTQPTNPSSDE